MSRLWDAIVIGAGPAGASCAVWLRQLGFEPLLLDAASAPGGLLRTNSYLDVWTITSPGRTGQDMAQEMTRQIEMAGVSLRCDAPVLGVKRSTGDSEEAIFEVQHAGSGNSIVTERARNVVIASGVRARAPEGASDVDHDGLLIGPGEHVMHHDYAGLHVAILGGGDNAFENYLFVKSKGAISAHIYARNVRAQQQFVRQVPAEDVTLGQAEIDLMLCSVNGKVYDRLLVFYGWEPRTQFLDQLDVRRDDRGFIDVDPVTAQTSVPGLYAIGEVTQRMHPCVPTAMADGVVAAKAIEKTLSRH